VKTKESLAIEILETPIGALRLVASARGLRRVDFANGAKPASHSGDDRAKAHLARAEKQLREYFAGQRREFTLTLDPEGDGFPQRVWQALSEIPFGETLTYGQVAARLGNRAAARAVGRACATNPIPVVVPCHRVLDSAGKLHGYGGGLWRKQRLLELEGAGSKIEKRK